MANVFNGIHVSDHKTLDCVCRVWLLVNEYDADFFFFTSGSETAKMFVIKVKVNVFTVHAHELL